MKTSELQGAGLDWAVAKCEGYNDYRFDGKYGRISTGQHFCPSTDWAQGGPIIEQEKIDLECQRDQLWQATCWDGVNRSTIKIRSGETPLIAAMRCYVASKLGGEVEIPEELK